MTLWIVITVVCILIYEIKHINSNIMCKTFVDLRWIWNVLMVVISNLYVSWRFGIRRAYTNAISSFQMHWYDIYLYVSWRFGIWRAYYVFVTNEIDWSIPVLGRKELLLTRVWLDYALATSILPLRQPSCRYAL